MIDVLLADDQPLIRGGFRALLDAEPDIRVVGEDANGREAVELALRHRPDVALVDIQMPVMDGMATTRCIAAHAELSDLHVVILTNYGFDEYVFETLRAGASGYLVKDIEPEDLLHAVRVVAKGDTLLAPTITRKLIAEYVRRSPPAHTSSTLDVPTNREREVVALVARGLSNDEIGTVVTISPTTAKTHVSRAMTKLGARDRAQLVVLAYESGLVLPRRRD
jgi:DNA-binding NarL/FixJ family response regulator